MMRGKRSRQSGFTLLEIMVVVVIIGIFATFVVLQITGNPHEARLVKVKQDMNVFAAALEEYKLHNFHYPSTEQGLRALVEKPSGDPPVKKWKEGGYIQQLKKDPWEHPYEYLSPGQNHKYEIISYGADGAPGGEGVDKDLTNWDDDSAQANNNGG